MKRADGDNLISPSIDSFVFWFFFIYICKEDEKSQIMDGFATFTRPCAADGELHGATVQPEQALRFSNHFLFERDSLKIPTGPLSSKTDPAFVTVPRAVCPGQLIQRAPPPFDL